MSGDIHASLRDCKICNHNHAPWMLCCEMDVDFKYEVDGINIQELIEENQLLRDMLWEAQMQLQHAWDDARPIRESRDALRANNSKLKAIINEQEELMKGPVLHIKCIEREERALRRAEIAESAWSRMRDIFNEWQKF